MNKEVVFDTLIDLFCILTLLGVVLYLPLKSHWNRIFSLIDAILVGCGIAVPAMVVYFFVTDSAGITSSGGESLYEYGVGIAVAAGFGILGILKLFECWGRCNGIIDLVLMPFVMVMMIGIFAFILLVILTLPRLCSGESRWYWDNY